MNRARPRRLTAVGLLLLLVALPVGAARPAGPASINEGDSAESDAPTRPAPTATKGADPVAPRRQTEVPAWLLLHRLTDVRLDDPRGPIRGNTDILRDSSDVRDDLGPFELSGSIDDAPSTDLRTLLVRGERWHLLRFDGVASSRPLETKVTAFGQVPYILRDADDLVTGEESYSPALLGVTGEVAGFEVGAQYRSLGRRLERIVGAAEVKKDQEGGEVWLARRFGAVRLRVSQSDLSDNVDDNPALPRTTRSQTAVTAELSVPAGPILGMTYGAGESERVRLLGEGPSGTPERQASQSVTASAFYVGAGWDIAVSTTYVLSRGLAGAEGDTAGMYHGLSLSLRPSDSVAITPALSAGREHDEATAAQWDTGSASVTLSYSPPRSRWYVWSTAGYTGVRGTDGLATGISVSGGLGLDLARIGTQRRALSVEAGYDQYRDGVAPRSSFDGAFALLLFKIAGF